MKSAFVFLTDNNFLPGTKALINSMFHHCPEFKQRFDEIDYFFISDEIKKEIFIDYKKATIVNPLDHYKSNPTDVSRYKKTFYKLMLFEDIFQEYDLVYYFDSDLLCLNDFYDILPWNIYKKKGRFDFYACADNGRFVNKIHKKSGRPYFNSGLFIFNPKKFTDSTDFLTNQTENPTQDGGEQPILNDLVQFKRASFCLLQDSYNVLKRVYEKYPELYRTMESKFKIKFLHYVQNKPWNSVEPRNKKLWDIWKNSSESHHNYFALRD